MTATERLTKVEELREEISNLEREETAENRALILPFLQENCVCRWDTTFGVTVICKSNDGYNELVKLIQSKQDGGWHHFGCPITDGVEIRSDDGTMTLRFLFNGKPPDIQAETIRVLKELKLKVDFNDAKQNVQRFLDQQNKKMENLLNLEKQFNQPIV